MIWFVSSQDFSFAATKRSSETTEVHDDYLVQSCILQLLKLLKIRDCRKKIDENKFSYAYELLNENCTILEDACCVQELK